MTEEERIQSIKKNGGCHLQNFKKENITYDMCLAAVMDDGEAIEYVPDDYKTKEIYTEACRSNGMVLKKVPPMYASEKVYEIAVSSSGAALQFVPPESISLQLCRQAVLDSPTNFQYVPEKLITPELCIESLTVNGYEFFNLMPKEIKNNTMCLALVKLNPEILWHLPKKNRTVKICKEAIKGFGFNDAADAVKKMPRLLSKLNASLYTEYACLAFVESDYFSKAVQIRDESPYGPKYAMTAKLNLYDNNIRIDDDEYPLNLILRWQSVATIAINKCWRLLGRVPTEVIDYDLCKLAVSKNAEALVNVPEEFRTRELCEYATMQNPYNISYVPSKYITIEMSNRAIEYNGNTFKCAA